MQKETAGSIITKLVTLAAFCAFIIGGGYLMYNSFVDEEWSRFALGCGLLAIGFFLMGALCRLIMRYEQNGSLGGLSPVDCIKTGALVMFLASCLVFAGVGVMLWISNGMWEIGVAGIAALVVMIFTAIEISIGFQTDGATKRVKKDPNAAEHAGVVTTVIPRFPIMLFFKTVYLFYEYVVEIDGIKSTAYLRRGNKMRKALDVGSRVTVKFDPDHPKNCAILECK